MLFRSALRLLIEKGAVSPELTQSMINAIAPDIMNKVREVQQAESVAPVPPEIEQILNQASNPGEAPAQEQPPTEQPQQ